MATRKQLLDRLLFSAAKARLQDVREALRSFQAGSHTGKAYRDVYGDVVGRGKGIMPSLSIQYPEVSGWTPGELLKTIESQKGRKYLALLDAAVSNAEDDKSLQRIAKQTTVADLQALPPVLYPAHKGSRRCTHCGEPHARSQHRFHGKGSFDRTHGRTGRREVPDFYQAEEVPAWVLEENSRRRVGARVLRKYKENSPVGFRIGRALELRYERDTGRHKGLYKHTFETSAQVVPLPDHSVLNGIHIPNGSILLMAGR